jgi:hypothetical protein
MATTLLQRQFNLFSLFLPFFLLSHSPLPWRHSNDPDQKKLSTANSKCKDEKRERLCFWYGEGGKERESKEKSIVKLIFFLILACNVDCLI